MTQPFIESPEAVLVSTKVFLHPRFLRLQGFLRDRGESHQRAALIGSLLYLFLKTKEQSSGRIQNDGDIAHYVARVSMWQGTPRAWLDGLLSAGFIEQRDNGFFLNFGGGK